MNVDPKMLELLVCPLTKTSLRFDATKNELISDDAALAYPIRGGVPVMMTSQARKLEEHERIRRS